MSAIPTWVYRSVAATDPPAILDALGSAGWELVGVAEVDGLSRLFFKRPAPDFRERVTLEQKRRVYEARGIALATDEDAP